MAEASSELARLKDLLLQPEATRLERLQDRVGALDQRVGTREALEESTAEVLVAAFRQAETREHHELARAVAPVVVAAIQSEIRNSRDMMVEALYPITGRLVAAAVANAFNTLLATINERLDTMLSMRLWRLRFKSIVTGRPLGELLLADATKPHLLRLLLLERGSGVLLAAWSADAEHAERADLVSGMIAAITEFSANAFEHEGGELRTIDMGASRILLRSSARLIVAGEFAGPMRPQDEAAVDEGFEKLIAVYGRGAGDAAAEVESAAAALRALSKERQSSAKKGGPAIWIVAALVLALAAVWGWRVWSRAQFENTIHGALAAAVAGAPERAAYPLSLDIDHGDSTVRLKGLMASAADASAITAALEAKSKPYKLDARLAIVGSSAAYARELHALADRLASSLRQSQDSIAALSTRASADTRRLNEVSSGLASLAVGLTTQARKNDAATSGTSQNLAALGEELAALRKLLSEQQDNSAALRQQTAQVTQRLDALSQAAESLGAGLQQVAGYASPRDRAARMIRRAAIFFDGAATFRDPQLAQATLDELAKALHESALGIRVIGYASNSGNGVQNLALAQSRSAAVAKELAERGVPAAQIVTVSRPSGPYIDDAPDGPGNANRRVEFEPLFDGEKTSR